MLFRHCIKAQPRKFCIKCFSHKADFLGEACLMGANPCITTGFFPFPSPAVGQDCIPDNKTVGRQRDGSEQRPFLVHIENFTIIDDVGTAEFNGTKDSIVFRPVISDFATDRLELAVYHGLQNVCIPCGFDAERNSSAQYRRNWAAFVIGLSVKLDL